MDVAVFEAIKAGVAKTFTNEPYVGTLDNGGVYLAPFHDFDAKVSAETRRPNWTRSRPTSSPVRSRSNPRRTQVPPLDAGVRGEADGASLQPLATRDRFSHCGADRKDTVVPQTAADRSSDASPRGLSLRAITKRFGSFVANDAVDLEVRPGEIHCLLGENGAGKSTLMNVLYGLYQPDGGEIVIDGVPAHFANPKQAMAAGIGMVHQHFMLVEVFTVAENVMLGRERGRPGPRHERGPHPRAGTVGALRARRVDPDALIEELPVGVQQRVEILKALANDAQYLIFDEPTAVLTPQEIDELMAVMTSLRDEGKAIVFITHKLREVRAIADRITVIRRGRIVGQAEPGTVRGRPRRAHGGPRRRPARRQGAAAVGKRPLRGARPDGGQRRRRHRGRRDQLRRQRGRDPVRCGRPGQRPVRTRGRAARRHRRHRRAPSPSTGWTSPIAETRGDHRGRSGLRAGGPAARRVRQLLHRGREPRAQPLRPPAVRQGRRPRPGGDRRQRRAAAGRVRHPHRPTSAPCRRCRAATSRRSCWPGSCRVDLSLLVASQPTRGVDVGAIEFLHKRIVAERDKGTAVLLVSTELDEVEALADRVLVMYRGKVVGIVPPDTPRDVLGLMMAGVGHEEALRQRRRRREQEQVHEAAVPPVTGGPSELTRVLATKQRACIPVARAGPSPWPPFVLALLVGAILMVIVATPRWRRSSPTSSPLPPARPWGPPGPRSPRPTRPGRRGHRQSGRARGDPPRPRR